MSAQSLEPVAATEPGRRLYEAHSAWFIRRLTKRYGAQEAEELAQEVWVRLLARYAWNSVEHPRALLLTIARHLASDRTDARTRASRCAQELAVFGGIGIEFSNQSTGVLAKELILGLPQPLRDVFVLSRFAGLTNVQIGERLGISPKTVEWRMTKALAHCAAQLRR